MGELRNIGVDRNNAEQEEKVRLLEYLLSSCNDGRRKTLFSLAVNLLELPEMRAVVDQLMAADLPTVKERAWLDCFRRTACISFLIPRAILPGSS